MEISTLRRITLLPNWAWIFTLCMLATPAVIDAQPALLTHVLNQDQWEALFPKRAGTEGGHPQGYSEDFYAYGHLIEAAQAMGDYAAEIVMKEGVWGQKITLTRKSSNTSYAYAEVEPWWYAHPNPEITVHVDFEDFVNRTSQVDNLRELAAFLAHISKETTGGWQFPIGGGSFGDYALWGLYFVHEVGYNSSNSAGAYSQWHSEFPPNPTVGYYGRGPVQLSWNYNYGQFSKFLFNDKNILLDNPDLLQEDGVLAFQSAIWFWMMPQCPKPSCHQVMHDLWVPQAGEYQAGKMYTRGFAHTNNIINGGLECRPTSTAAFTEKVVLRSALYQYYLEILGFGPEDLLKENTPPYSTLCFESPSLAMQDYLSCNLEPTLSTQSRDKGQVEIFPNPAIDHLTLRGASPIDRVEIFNAWGHLVGQANPGTHEFELDLSALMTGVYALKILSKNTVFTRQIVIKS